MTSFWQLQQSQAKPAGVWHALRLWAFHRWHYVRHGDRWYKYKRSRGRVYWLQQCIPPGWRIVR